MVLPFELSALATAGSWAQQAQSTGGSQGITGALALSQQPLVAAACNSSIEFDGSDSTQQLGVVAENRGECRLQQPNSRCFDEEIDPDKIEWIVQQGQTAACRGDCATNTNKRKRLISFFHCWFIESHSIENACVTPLVRVRGCPLPCYIIRLARQKVQ
jgi:hypothetical protein